MAAPTKYPGELRERAMRLYREIADHLRECRTWRAVCRLLSSRCRVRSAGSCRSARRKSTAPRREGSQRASR